VSSSLIKKKAKIFRNKCAQLVYHLYGLQTRCNALAWNPREAFNFTVANEDCNCYTYDMRKMKGALGVHKDHVSAV
jgi:hypothetical protein